MSTVTLQRFAKDLSELVRTGALGKALHRGTIDVGVVAKKSAQMDFLRGPRPALLGAITGDLRRSVRKKTTPTSKFVRLTLSAGGGPAQVDYAAVHEFGFTGAVQVKQHTRTTVFGRTVDPFQVGPYTRMMDIRARPYLRPGRDKALQQAPQIFTAEIGDTLRRGLGGN